jgi:hypothetical protein
MSSNRRFKACTSIPTRNLGEDIVWLNPLASKLYNGNQTAAFIYKHACEGRTESEIIVDLLAEYEGDAVSVQKETKDFLDLLLNEGILEEVE